MGGIVAWNLWRGGLKDPAAEFRHTFTIKAPPTARDGYGEVKDLDYSQYSTVASVRGSLNRLTGREYFAAGHQNHESSVKIRIRARTDVKPKHILVEGTAVYEIESVTSPSGLWQSQFLDLDCIERT